MYGAWDKIWFWWTIDERLWVSQYHRWMYSAYCCSFMSITTGSINRIFQGAVDSGSPFRLPHKSSDDAQPTIVTRIIGIICNLELIPDFEALIWFFYVDNESVPTFIFHWWPLCAVLNFGAQTATYNITVNTIKYSIMIPCFAISSHTVILGFCMLW